MATPDTLLLIALGTYLPPRFLQVCLKLQKRLKQVADLYTTWMRAMAVSKTHTKMTLNAYSLRPDIRK
eukprot:5671460-Amphidinium_carterae.2